MRALIAALLLLLVQEPRAEAQELRDRVREILEEEPGIVLRELVTTERAVTIGIEVPETVRLHDLPPAVENRLEIAAGAISAMHPAIDAINLLVAHPHQKLRPPPSRPASPKQKVVRSVVPDPSRYPFGQALLGKTVALSPGHGWIFFDNLGGYSTQRGNVRWTGCDGCRGITEDFETHEIVIRYLIPLLEGAGARVVLVRERDYGEDVLLIDDADAGYVESNGTFADGVSEGGNGGDYRTSFDPGAKVEWTFTAPASGQRTLSLWFVAGANRLQDARLEVETPGGRHEYLVDLTAHGRRWAPIELLDLQGGDAITARLMSPLGGAGDRVLVGDAVRLGAGKHPSDHPWWQMGAEEFAAHQAAPADVLAYGDVTIRPRYAEFYGADAYVSVHSNASGQPDSTAAGTATYRYNCGAFPDHSNDPDPSQCDDPIGSDRLQDLVHRYLVEQVRAEWDASWIDRGPKVANFGELRELDGIPGVLIESAFHDNVRLPAGSALRATDNQSLHDARWRRAAAFGIYRGISEFLVGAGSLVARPPEALALRRVDRTSIELSFGAVPGAMGYRVYLARGGRTFDQGQIVETSSVVIGDLPEGAPIAVKVSSLNSAGEGPGSRVVVARPSARRAQALIVDAFEREDAWVQEIDNRGDTALAYSLAAASTQYAFDGANEAALASGLIDLAGYDAIIFALGRESTEHGILTSELRDRVEAFVAAGGAVFAAGSEIGYALDGSGAGAFLENVFGAQYASDDAGATAIAGSSGAWLANVSSPLAALSDTGLLEARSSDVLAPIGTGVVELFYGAGTDAAAVRRDKSLLLGVALDSVTDLPAREQILGGWLSNAVELAPEDVIMPPADGGVAIDGGELDGGEIAPDAGPIVKPDGSEPIEDAAIAEDATSPIGVRRLSEDPITGGCGCSSMGERSRSAWSVLLLLGLVRLLRSRTVRHSTRCSPSRW